MARRTEVRRSVSRIKKHGSKERAAFMAILTRELYLEIHEAFMIKSRGDADKFGEKWEPLKPATIERKLHKQRRRAARTTDPISKRQRDQWREVYHETLPIYKSYGFSHQEAVAAAREKAWQSLKLPKNKSVPIGIDTQRLEKSLRTGRATDGVYNPPASTKDQIVEIRPQSIHVGTKTPYARNFDKRRKIIPDPTLLLQRVLPPATRKFARFLKRSHK